MTKDKEPGKKMSDAEFHDTAAKLLGEQQEADKKAAPKTEEQKTVDLAAETLTGDIRDFLLDRVKTLGKPWAAMSEDEQSDQIHGCRDAAEKLVKTACEVIASKAKKAMVGKLIKIQIKDKIQCQVDFNVDDESRHELYDSQGMHVSLVVADAQPFTGERAPAEAEPEQGSLIDNAEKLKKDSGKVTTLKKRKDIDGDDADNS